MREKINAAMKDAIKARDARRTTTLRLINAAIKDREIAARGEGKDGISDEDIMALLQKMVKQREESAGIYAEAGRAELEAQEREEMEIIKEFLPKPLSEEEVDAAIKAAIAETGAEGLRDMGKVVGVLKAKYPGQIDFGKASKQVKAQLGA
ncbi:GatB/YqeY domain-containing protein [Pelagibacterium xiamenense]|uniref:GatB/YqeY domain-containing protein n=1 Tax=Pelagibacterium xiamenense TaxID=2901140 RepID=UPI001E2D43AD|nr:GatB/YqeY domain-containing protein [Pelagibacterium xiamenense]MCD7060227.1 GatB/YqeY domain-containing protein [Pelagibacterium xiamenense]